MVDLKPETMLLEWKQNGRWYGTTDEKRIRKFRERAEKYLMEHPDRYFYPLEYEELIRLSYADQ